MQSGLETLLEIRRRYPVPGRRGGKAAALGLHALAIALVVVAPTLRAQRQEPPEFVAVQIVPAQRLGIEQPPAPKPQPAAEVPEAPAPEPPKPEAEPEPAPPPEPAPALPAPAKPQPAAAPERRPASPPAPAADPPETIPAPLGSPQGSAQGAQTGAAVAGLDNPDFTYGYYVDQMLALIRAQWQRPPLGGGIEARVHFEIGRDGAVTEVRIVGSSGYSSFDLSGLRAVQAASPLPPLPKSYRQGSLGVTLIIR